MPFTENAKLSLINVNDAAPFAAELFQKSFGDSIPNFPTHLVLLLNEKGKTLTLGYVHFTKQNTIYLGGGMCVNTRVFRQIPKTIRKTISVKGGVAFLMLSESVKLLNDCEAIFGYVGHQGAYKIDMAVGFEQTTYPNLIVYWKNRNLEESTKSNLIKEAHSVGPF